ncbi:Argininosuccinate lyase [hydrothermal vent metagenome]|uniref:Argininosuccinate lyase n=1 Tax=hydrothermal vent metagenome TaxID=652676 RepID=A0A3B0YDF4_9ZZZZ
MGLDVLIASNGEYSLISEVHGGLHIDIDNHPASLKAVLIEAEQRPFAGVLGSDDSTVELAAKVAEQLGLPHNPPDAARLTRRKDLARAHLSSNSCAVPMHCLIDLKRPLHKQMTGLLKALHWPCVIKPLNLSASRGVIRVNNEAEFIQACERIKPLIANLSDEFESRVVLVEQYIDGVEVAFEGYMHRGKLHTLVIFDKPEPLTGPYFEETIYVTPSGLGNKIQQKIIQRVEEACEAYGLVTGPVHAELRIDQQDAWILEVASRTIGGDCARSLDAGNDFNLEELTISLAINKILPVKAPVNARGVMMIPIKQGGILRRVEGLSEARLIPHIEKVDIIIREGNELIPLPEGNQYPGYIFAQAETPQVVVAALKAAYDKLNFVVAPVFKLHQNT